MGRKPTQDLLFGSRYGIFTVTGKTKRKLTSGWYTYYICKCYCGNIREVPKHHLVYGNSTSCGCVNRRNHTLLPGESTINEKYMICRNTAKNRNLEFSLKKEVYKNIVTSPCHYCGENPSKYNRYLKKDGSKNKDAVDNCITQSAIDNAWVFINTVDRMNSKLGYIPENCVPACWPCNEMKMDSKYEDFILQAYKIVSFQNNKIQQNKVLINERSI